MDEPASNATTLTPQEYSRQLFEMEKSFREQLLAENDRERRKRLYSEFYSQWTSFNEQYQPGIRNFGSFSPELMQLMVPFVRGKTLLDFGCGYGFATFDLAIYSAKVVAADESKPMIENLQERIHEKGITKIEPLFLGDNAEDGLTKYEGSIDVVYSNDVVEHLHPDDMQEHLELVFRLLRPRGLYICITPNRITGPHDVSAQFLPYHATAQGAHIREYSHRELCDVFRNSGFVRFRTPVTAVGYHRLRSDAAYRRLLVPPQFKFSLEAVWFGRSKKHQPKLLNLFCLNKVVLFAWKP